MSTYYNAKTGNAFALLVLFGLWALLFSFAFNYYSSSRTVTNQTTSAATVTDWGFRQEIIIDDLDVPASSNLTDFPVLIDITSNASLASNAQPDGDDIIFGLADGTEFPHDKITYNSSTGELLAWVKVPILYASQDTVFYMYYDNPSITVNQDNPSLVWSDYTGVWSFEEDPGSSGQVLDSTSNDIDGTAANMESGDRVTSVVANGYSFDGIDEHIDFGDNDIVSINSGEDFTVSFWLKTTEQARTGIFTKGAWGQPGLRIELEIDGDTLKNRIETDNGTLDDNQVPVPSPTLDNNNWRHIVQTFDLGTAVSMYVDGVFVADDELNLVNGGFTNDISFFIARNQGGNYITAELDEVRFIKGTVLTADWIATEYANQSNASSFISLGQLEDASTALCGNSTVEFGETCDDGNTQNGDQCSSNCINECTAPEVWDGSSCSTPVCGNGVIEGSEVCDDGNTANDDQCSFNCANECTAPAIWDGSSCITPVCGNGNLEGTEVCDDGNTANNDQCSDDCLNSCVSPQIWNGTSCITPQACGNGVVEGAEVCDDGNTVNGDQCSSDCANQCTAPEVWDGTTCVTPQTCGNGTVEGTEVCDDGNTSNGDQCSSDCQNSCTSPEFWNGQSCATPSATCGDGNIDSGEECDNGSSTNGTVCDPAYGDTCEYCSDSCTTITLVGPYCGDNQVDISNGEVCDDGNNLNNDSCSSTCTVECNDGQVYNGAQCVEEQESCDSGEVLVDNQCIVLESDEAVCADTDSNSDNQINLIDFASFAQKYLKTCVDTNHTANNSCGKTDSDNNNYINIVDFASFALQYNSTCN